MRVSANYGVRFSADNSYSSSLKLDNRKYFLPVQNDSVNISKQKATSSKNNAFLLSAAALLAVVGCVVGVKAYIRHLNTKLLENLPTPLPEGHIADSFSDTLKKELSINHRFDKLMSFIEHPQEDKIAGTGANSKVYNLPFLNKYVLKILDPRKRAEPNQIPIGIFPENVNLGQPVWVHPDNFRIMLLKKVSGEPHSIADWSSTIWHKDLRKALTVSKQQAEDYYGKVIKIASLKQKVYNDLAYQIKILDSTPKSPNDYFIGFKTDSINPNNLLVDLKKEKLNFIDYFGKNNPEHKNSYLDMVSVITDFTLFREYYDWLEPKKQKLLLSAIKTIDKKSYLAAKNIDLSTDKNRFVDFIDFTDRYFHVSSVPKHDGHGEYVRQYGISAKYMLKLLDKIRNDNSIKLLN